MPVLTKSLIDWDSPKFSETLLQELRGLKAGLLPLQCEGGWIDFTKITINITKCSSDDRYLTAMVGVFFMETLSGGSCGFEAEPEQKYCDVRVVIDRKTAEVDFAVL